MWRISANRYVVYTYARLYNLRTIDPFENDITVFDNPGIIKEIML